jgi:hypothetical protein
MANNKERIKAANKAAKAGGKHKATQVVIPRSRKKEEITMVMYAQKTLGSGKPLSTAVLNQLTETQRKDLFSAVSFKNFSLSIMPKTESRRPPATELHELDVSQLKYPEYEKRLRKNGVLHPHPN